MHRAACFHGAKLDLGLREKIGQMGFVAALSGFRSLVADALWIHASIVWERTEWAAMKLDFDAVTTLQPRCILFWDMAAWHMALNASIAAYEDRKQPREALRLKAQREYWKLGEDYLLRGIANNPDSADALRSGSARSTRTASATTARPPRSMPAPPQLPDAPRVRAALCRLRAGAAAPATSGRLTKSCSRFTTRARTSVSPRCSGSLGELQEKLNVPAEQKVDIPPPKP